jgi:hypothetical protein
MQNILSKFIFSTPQFGYRGNALQVALPCNLRQLIMNKVATYLVFIKSVLTVSATCCSIFPGSQSVQRMATRPFFELEFCLVKFEKTQEIAYAESGYLCQKLRVHFFKVSWSLTILVD